jgi:hypothetical protein
MATAKANNPCLLEEAPAGARLFRCGGSFNQGARWGSGADVGIAPGGVIEAGDIIDPFTLYMPELLLKVPTTFLAGQAFEASTQGPAYLLGCLAILNTSTITLSNLSGLGGGQTHGVDVIDASGVQDGNVVSGAISGLAGNSDSEPDSASAVSNAQSKIATAVASLPFGFFSMGSLIRVFQNTGDGSYLGYFFILVATI